MNRQLSHAALLALWLGGAHPAGAAERGETWYLQAAVGATHLGGALDGESSTFIAVPGGTTLGWQLTGGFFVTKVLSLEAESASTGVAKAEEPSRHGMIFHEERRNRFFGANARFHLDIERHFDVEPVVGVALLRQEGWSQTEYYHYDPRPHEWGPRERLEPLWAGSFTAGLDLRVGVRRFSAVPWFRFRRPFHGADSPWYPDEVWNTTVAAGLGARIAF